MAQHQVCTACGYYGLPKRAIKGNGLIELVLWLCFLIPGIIYSIYRSSSRHNKCPICGNPNLIPASSPIAQRMIQNKEISTEVSTVNPNAGGFTGAGFMLMMWWFLSIFLLFMSYAQYANKNENWITWLVFGILTFPPLTKIVLRIFKKKK